MKRLLMFCIAVAATASAGIAQAQHAPWPADWNNWNDPALWATVGNPGNAGEWSGQSYGGYGPDRICGAVDYTYNIGKYEVTTGQYTAFLNAVATSDDTYGLYDVSTKISWSLSSEGRKYSVTADWANRPVMRISWGDAARFCNWLHNGQPTGMQDLTTTEDGSYYLNGAKTDAALLAVTRKANATYVIPSGDEWYKAAYHKNDGVTGNFFDYPTGSDIIPSNVLGNPTDPGNNATFYVGGFTIDSPYWRTEVGSHENSDSPYGTFDQGGNIGEWNEALIASGRGVYGGAFDEFADYLLASTRHNAYPTAEVDYIGFRVAYVPEPSTFALLGMGAIALLVCTWRRRLLDRI
jgi:formylglycine-generating enzyme